MKKQFLLSISMVLCGWVSVFGQAGALDGSFGVGGKVTTEFYKSYDDLKSAALQPDGKILFSDEVIARFHPDGTKDASFGTDGIISLGFPTHIALQPDGKIVAAGTQNDNFAILRYNEDGSLDTSFGQNGMVITDFNGGDDKANAIAIQPDGKIIVAGESDGDFAIARYLSGLETDVIEKPETKVSVLDLTPNPATDLLYLALPDTAAPTDLAVFDVQGRLVLSQKFAAGDALRVGHLPGGVFMVKVTDGERVYVGRFVKQ